MNFTAAVTKIFLLVQKLSPFQGPEPEVDPEAAVPVQAAAVQATAAVPVQVARYQNLDRAKIIVVFSLASAIDIALLSVQVHSHLPIIFYFLDLAILLAFTCFFTSKSVHSNCPLVAHVLERFGIFFGVTAFFISITIPFPAVWFKCIACFIYAISWLLIFFCNSFVSA